jgi:hypothetical protein
MQSGTHQYHQKPLLKRINLYLKKHNLSLIDEDGYCHGLTLLWLAQMAERNEKWYYDTIYEIIDAADTALNEFNSDLEKFVAKIEMAQNPYVNTSEIFPDDAANILYQKDIHKILELKENNPDYKKDLFSHNDLQGIINKINNQNNCVVISVVGKHPEFGHTIAIFYRDGLYHLYDANKKKGKAKITKNKDTHYHWVLKHLYEKFKDKVPEMMHLEVTHLHMPCSLKRKAGPRQEPPTKRKKTKHNPTLFHAEQQLPVKPQIVKPKTNVSGHQPG